MHFTGKLLKTVKKYLKLHLIQRLKQSSGIAE